MANIVASRSEPLYSPRNNIPYYQVPTNFRTQAHEIIKTEDLTRVYGQVLDCVFEMSGEIADANGVGPLVAIDKVCQVEHWKLLPTHREMLVKRLAVEAGDRLGVSSHHCHLYDVEVDFGRGMTAKIEVYARHRSQVFSLIRQHGLKPCSVNMIG